MSYNPRDHMWIVGGSTTSVWSSKARAYILISSDEYAAWLADDDDRVPTIIATENDLNLVLAPFWKHSPRNCPPEIPAWKALIVIEQFGLTEAAAAYIGQAPPDAVAFTRASSFSRDSGLMVETASALGLTDEQLNAMFRAADAIAV